MAPITSKRLQERSPAAGVAVLLQQAVDDRVEVHHPRVLPQVVLGLAQELVLHPSKLWSKFPPKLWSNLRSNFPGLPTHPTVSIRPPNFHDVLRCKAT